MFSQQGFKGHNRFGYAVRRTRPASSFPKCWVAIKRETNEAGVQREGPKIRAVEPFRGNAMPQNWAENERGKNTTTESLKRVCVCVLDDALNDATED